MTTPAKRRLVKDFKRLQKDPPSGVSAAPQENDIMKWNGVIFGPDDTPWDGGTFKLTLEFTEVRCRTPPRCRCLRFSRAILCSPRASVAARERRTTRTSRRRSNSCPKSSTRTCTLMAPSA